MRNAVLALMCTLAASAAHADCSQEGPTAPLALHQTWIMQGWERHEQDPEFVFAEKMAKYYDLENPKGVFWDNFAPGETQLFTDANVYGPNWEPLQAAAKSIKHGMTDGNSALVGQDIASTTVGFVGRLEKLDGSVVSFDARSQLGWRCVGDAWKIKQEMNYAWVVEPEAIDSILGRTIQP